MGSQGTVAVKVKQGETGAHTLGALLAHGALRTAKNMVEKLVGEGLIGTRLLEEQVGDGLAETAAGLVAATIAALAIAGKEEFVVDGGFAHRREDAVFLHCLPAFSAGQLWFQYVKFHNYNIIGSIFMQN